MRTLLGVGIGILPGLLAVALLEGLFKQKS
jgi:hypothetical protein